MKRYSHDGACAEDPNGRWVSLGAAEVEIDSRDKRLIELAAENRGLQTKVVAQGKRIAELEHAVRTMLAAVADAPEQFPGQNAAYLQTVAIPRAIAALALGVPK